jgi:hypothetical protein
VIKGYAERRLDRFAWEVAIVDRERKRSYTMDFRVHDLKDGELTPTTLFPLDDLEVVKAFAEALQVMGVLSPDAVTSELKATKFHLDDMRKLVFHMTNLPNEEDSK